MSTILRPGGPAGSADDAHGGPESGDAPAEAPGDRPAEPVPAAVPSARGALGAGRARRRDIEGLRALAILAVVAYHARPSALPGGYVGVDVFFVVSGFCITRLLWRELEEHGRISARRFYAARARRLLPACALVVATSAIAAAALWPPPAAAGVAKDALAAALYVSNYRFAAQASNYLTASGPLSPLQHSWSLGVEEQFYLLWPLVLAVGSLAWRRARRPSRRAAAVVVAVVAVASFALCWHLTATDEPWAFYSLPSRAFELATGGLVALGEQRLARARAEVAAAASWVGLGLVLAAVATFGPGTAFPGSAALAPVIGTAAVLASGCAPRRSGAGLVLDRRPMQWIAAVSYSWYLWHYPVLVLAPSVIGRPLDPLGATVAAGFALALAVLTTMLLERPVRYSPFLATRAGTSLLAGGASSLAAASVAVLAVASLPGLGGDWLLAPSPVRLASASFSRAGQAIGTALAGAFDRGRPPASAASARAASLAAGVESVVAAAARATRVPATISPPLEQASSDAPVPFFDGCFDGFTDTVVHTCTYGDTTSSKSVVLFGDSHAMMWFPVLDGLALEDHLQLVALGKATCPPLDLEVFSPDLDEWYSACDEWRAAAVARIDALRPAVVVLGFSREYGVVNDHVLVYGRAWLRGLAEMITTLRAAGARVVVLGPVPYPPFHVPACLAAHLDDPLACSMPDEAPWYDRAGVAAEQAVVRKSGASYLDLQRFFCTPARCLTMIGGMVAYRDDNHVSATYATWLTPAISAQLALVDGGRL